MRRITRGSVYLTVMVAVVTGCAGGKAPEPTTSSPTASPTPAPSPIPSIGPLLSASPTLTTVDGQIVFFDDGSASPHRQIYIERADGSDAHQLVVSDYDDFKPRLSPDGRTVAFTRFYPDASNIVVVNVDGTGLKVIDKASCVKPCGGDEDVSWSPDGTQIAMTRNLFDAPDDASTPQPPFNVALWVMRADGTGAHQLTLAKLVCRNVCKGGAQDNRAAWSPDGKRLVFTRDSYTKPEQYGIFTIAADGGDLRRVTPDTMNADDPAWSPDGTLIAFQSPPDPTQGVEQSIYTIHPDGTDLIKLTSGMSATAEGFQGSNHPSWSPDGNQIVFSHFPGMNGVADLFVMNRDGSDLHPLAATALNENAPDWGP